jgi:hypothetical protein
VKVHIFIYSMIVFPHTFLLYKQEKYTVGSIYILN